MQVAISMMLKLRHFSETYKYMTCKSHVNILCQHIRKKSMNIKQVLQLDKENLPSVHVKGWITGIQTHKSMTFIKLSDNTCRGHVQLVLPSENLTEEYTAGSYMEAEGQLVPSAGQQQPFDLTPHQMRLISTSPQQTLNPIKVHRANYKNSHPPDYLRQILHLRCRTEVMASLMRIRNTATQAVHQFYQDDGYIQVHTPILTSNDCEGAGETFELKPSNEDMMKDANEDEATSRHFFNSPAFLTVSGQLHLEVMTGAFNKVYTFGPAFRAENSVGRHHLAEFYMIESEMNNTDTIEDVNKVMEELIKHATKEIIEKQEDDLAVYWQSKEISQGHRKIIENIVDKPFIRMDYTDAVEQLEPHNNKFKFKIKWGSDLQKEHERELVKMCGDHPVFVQNFPADIKPFYMRDNDDQKTVACVDLLCPLIGELCGGSLREERLDYLEQTLALTGNQNTYEWYLDLRRFASVPHGGFGLGFERYLMMLLGISNIRDTIPFPRYVRHCKL